MSKIEHDPALVERVARAFVRTITPRWEHTWESWVPHSNAALDAKAEWDAEHAEPSVEELIAEVGGDARLTLDRYPDGSWHARKGDSEVVYGDDLHEALLVLRDAVKGDHK